MFSPLSLKQSITQCLKLSLCYLLSSREFIDTLAGKSNKRRDLFMHLNKISADFNCCSSICFLLARCDWILNYVIAYFNQDSARLFFLPTATYLSFFKLLKIDLSCRAFNGHSDHTK